MERDPAVILLGEDIGGYGGAFKLTEGIIDRFGPERVLNTPIAEGGFVGVAVGAAMTGLRPVAEIMFMDFVTLAVDQLVNHAAKFHYQFGEQCRVPMVVRCPYGAGRGYGPTHSQSLERFFVATPGLVVVCPSTAEDAKGLLKSAIRCDDPVIFLESKILYGHRGEVPEGDYTVPLGQSRVAIEGDDATVLAYGRMVDEALKAAEALLEHGVTTEVLDLRTLAPLDAEAVKSSLEKTGRLVVVEEGTLTGGIGAEIVARVTEECFDYLQAPPKRVAASDTPVPSSRTLERAAIPDFKSIATAIADVVAY